MSIWRRGKATEYYRETDADIERWWTENADKFWNPETGMYKVAEVEEAVKESVDNSEMVRQACPVVVAEKHETAVGDVPALEPDFRPSPQ